MKELIAINGQLYSSKEKLAEMSKKKEEAHRMLLTLDKFYREVRMVQFEVEALGPSSLFSRFRRLKFQMIFKDTFVIYILYDTFVKLQIHLYYKHCSLMNKVYQLANEKNVAALDEISSLEVDI